MKKPVKKRIPRRQQGLLVKVALVLILAAVLWVVFTPGTGLVSLKRYLGDLEQLEQKIAELEKENKDLQSEIDGLQNDPDYLEEVARKEYGLLKKNERVYDFSKPSREKDK